MESMQSSLTSCCAIPIDARRNLFPMRSPDSSRKVQVFWHDGDPLGVNGTMVGIFKQTDKMRLGRFLQC